MSTRKMLIEINGYSEYEYVDAGTLTIEQDKDSCDIVRLSFGDRDIRVSLESVMNALRAFQMVNKS